MVCKLNGISSSGYCLASTTIRTKLYSTGVLERSWNRWLQASFPNKLFVKRFCWDYHFLQAVCFEIQKSYVLAIFETSMILQISSNISMIRIQWQRAHWELTELMCLLSMDVPFSGTAWPCSDVPFPGLMCLRAPTKYYSPSQRSCARSSFHLKLMNS